MNQARGAIKWALYMLALLVVGPLASNSLAALRDATGGHQATALVGASLRAGLIATFLPLLAATLLGAVASRLVGPRHGLLTAGLVLAWAAWRSATIDGLMRVTRDSGAIMPLAIEGAILGVIGLLIGAIVWGVGTAGEAKPTNADSAARTGLGAKAATDLLISASRGRGGAFTAIVIGVLAGAAAVWLIAQEPLKGQTIAACLVAGIAAGGFGKAVTPRDQPASPIPALAAMALLATLAPLSALVMHTSPRLVTDAIQGKLFALAIPMPLDWLAGAFWGIPIGLSWADSMVEKHEK